MMMEKNNSSTIKLGVVVVDSGKLMICDPLYLSDWQDNGFAPVREFKDVQTSKVYSYKKDFNKYTDVLLDNKTVKQLIAEKRLIEIEQNYNEKDFSYNSLCNIVNNKAYAQFRFPNGNAGLALAFLAGAGDGEYPVYAETINNEIKKVWIDFSEE